MQRVLGAIIAIMLLATNADAVVICGKKTITFNPINGAESVVLIWKKDILRMFFYSDTGNIILENLPNTTKGNHIFTVNKEDFTEMVKCLD